MKTAKFLAVLMVVFMSMGIVTVSESSMLSVSVSADNSKETTQSKNGWYTSNDKKISVSIKKAQRKQTHASRY